MLETLFLAGADIFRLNFSHGQLAEKAEVVDHIRALERKFNRPIAILADLQGPKLRVATFIDGHVELKEGQDFSFDLDAACPGAWKALSRALCVSWYSSPEL
jgi:pyruvate kinase